MEWLVFASMYFNLPNLLSFLFYFRGPYYLGVYDLANIRDSGAIFIRKVTKAIDHNILHLLPVNSRDEIPYIQWPKEINIINKPDWGRFQNVAAKDGSVE